MLCDFVLKMATVLAFTLVIWFVIVDGVEQRANCTSFTTCGKCIQAYGCTWCADPIFEISRNRCQNETGSKCSKKFLINPKSAAEKSVLVTEESTKKPEKQNNKSQKNVKNITPSIVPQFVNLTMRPNQGHPFRIKMTYHHSPNYPLDIYYLLDASYSMKAEKDNLGRNELATELAKQISKITNDLQLGFGSFVDKPVIPFIDGDSKISSRPCQGCIPAYSFRNHFSLSKNRSEFSKTVRSLTMSGNVDPLEGGFDGIMQAIVCRDRIGWRERARKLLVYSTDGPFHVAGDGRLLGILTPNDGCCHLDKNGFYTMSTNLDYPSISQIRRKVMEHAVHLIFSTTDTMSTLYKKLVDHIEVASVGVKREDSSYKDVIHLIIEQYRKITSGIKIEDYNRPEHVRIQYYSKCLNKNGPLVKTNECQGLKVNDTVEFELDIELLNCPADVSQWKHELHIQPLGIYEKMVVNLKMVCDCECNPKDNTFCEKNSSKCSGHGALQFGVCQCDAGYSKQNCSCLAEEDDPENCKERPGAIVCSGQGTCDCGKCHCDSSSPARTHWGKFCECSNSTCVRNQGKMCSGNGNCVCDECVCNEGWSGEDCSCETSHNNCLAAIDGEICSGYGDCVCNKCVCDPSKKYTGQYCETFVNNVTSCSELRNDVLCQLQPNNKCSYTNQTDTQTDMYMVQNLENLTTNYDNIRCTELDIQNCKFIYTYEIIGKKVKVKVLDHTLCDSEPLVITFAIGVISAIVLIGLLLLMLWKIFVIIQDRKEFSKFEEERVKAMWDNTNNPLYISPSTRYPNPLFEERSDWNYKSNKKD